MSDRLITVHAKKYDGRVRKTWTGGIVSESEELIVLIAKFDETVEHNDLGTIPAGTVSFEHFWTKRWYNIFRFHRPDGELLAYYANVAMPAVIEGDVLSYIDLDIDVIQWPDGRAEVLDRDDFERNQKKFGYTADVIANAEKGLADVLRLVEDNQLP